ncbi:MAG TPA: homoserine dehydrogenase [Phycisphaerae bacterium]|nr:homoserine dehydrogenase [Phycisphaerales bacterium]HRX84022.1 homoserine dehydrogenase [Phycisphaerae bacterium]
MREKKPLRVALAGCGTVGSGVGEIIVNRAGELAARTGVRFEVGCVLVSDVTRKREVPFPAEVFTDDPQALLASEYDLLVEVIGGTDIARTVVLEALAAGKPVVTANKALLALHGAEVYAAARAGGTCVAFEASCAGGLPIIGPLLRGLQANRVRSIMGIFNSTCNFVLTSMLDGGMSYGDAVQEAQRLGYAEADPTLDVSGGDTAHKLCVLASLALGSNIEYERIARRGIDRLQLTDLRIAREMGYSCKLVGIGRRLTPAPTGQPQQLYLAVRPTLIHCDHLLAGLSGTRSGVLVDGDVVGETFYSGSGAGSLPTASAVVADMIEVATGSAQATFNQLCVYNDCTPPADYVDPEEAEDSYYVRFSFAPHRRADMLADVDHAWRDNPVKRLQTHVSRDDHVVVAITAPVKPKLLGAAVRSVAGHLQLSDEPVMLPVLEARGS